MVLEIALGWEESGEAEARVLDKQDDAKRKPGFTTELHAPERLKDVGDSTGGQKRDARKLWDQGQLSPAGAVWGVRDIQELAFKEWESQGAYRWKV